MEWEIVKEICGSLVLETGSEVDFVNVERQMQLISWSPLLSICTTCSRILKLCPLPTQWLAAFFLQLSPSIPIFPSNIEGACPDIDKFQRSSLACTWEFLAEN